MRMIERANPIEVSIAYDEMKAKFRRACPEWRTLSKKMLADFLWIKPAVLYNPTMYRDLIFLAKVVMVIKSIKIDKLVDFVNTYIPWESKQDTFNSFFLNETSTWTSQEPSIE